MDEVLSKLEALLGAGETVALATIVATHGSAPREPGAKLLYRRDGQIVGTVGGGCGEAEVCRAAADTLDTGQARLVRVELVEELSAEAEKMCGGTMEVFVEAWPAEPELLDLVRTIRAGQDERGGAVLLTVVASDGVASAIGSKVAVLRHRETWGSFQPVELHTAAVEEALRRLREGRGDVQLIDIRSEGRQSAWRAQVLAEPLIPAPRLLIVGAGHIAQPLASMAKLLGLHVTVVDDRPTFANVARFPTADSIVVGDYAETVRRFPFDSAGYIVIITRGHRHDCAALRAALDTPASYVGMIGSRARVWAVYRLLWEDGVPREQIARLHAPIGVDLGAETPAEIALSIAAELVKVHRGGLAFSLCEAVRERYLAKLAGE